MKLNSLTEQTFYLSGPQRKQLHPTECTVQSFNWTPELRKLRENLFRTNCIPQKNMTVMFMATLRNISSAPNNNYYCKQQFTNGGNSQRKLYKSRKYVYIQVDTELKS